MRKRLLIACNNISDADGLRRAFEDLEEIEAISPTHNGFDTLEAIRTRKVDILLLDLFLSGMDGYSVIKAIDAGTGERRPLIFIMAAIADDRLLMPIKDRVLYCFSRPLDYALIQLRILQLLHQVEWDEKTDASPMDRMETQIAADILAVGVPAHVKGYYYLRDAVRIYSLSNSPTGMSVTKDLYPAVARMYDTRAPLVEHAIRNAIEIAWTRGNIETIHAYFGYTVNDYKGKPSNREFIAMMAQRARSRQKAR